MWWLFWRPLGWLFGVIERDVRLARIKLRALYGVDGLTLGTRLGLAVGVSARWACVATGAGFAWTVTPAGVWQGLAISDLHLSERLTVELV